MAKFSEFVGPFAQARSNLFNVEDTINFYLESGERGRPKAQRHLLGTGGLEPFVWLGAGPVRCLFEQDGRTFAVGGQFFFEILLDRSRVIRGQVAVDANPATISSNGKGGGHQLLITSGGFGYIFDLEENTFEQITDDNFPYPCSMALFFESYFIALHAITGIFHLSALLNGLEWNGLDVGQESQASDVTRSIIRTHDNLWLFGTKHTAPWQNSGAAAFPFQPIQGTLIEHAIHAIYSACQFDNTVFWLGRDKDGANEVWRANGYTPQRISTHAVEHYLDQVERTDDTIGVTYSLEGHAFYHLYVPHADASLVYDVKENEWHKRALWDPNRGIWLPDIFRCHCFAFGKYHLVGDRQRGGVYRLDLNYLDYALYGAA